MAIVYFWYSTSFCLICCLQKLCLGKLFDIFYAWRKRGSAKDIFKGCEDFNIVVSSLKVLTEPVFLLWGVVGIVVNVGITHWKYSQVFIQINDAVEANFSFSDIYCLKTRLQIACGGLMQGVTKWITSLSSILSKN